MENPMDILMLLVAGALLVLSLLAIRALERR